MLNVCHFTLLLHQHLGKTLPLATLSLSLGPGSSSWTVVAAKQKFSRQKQPLTMLTKKGAKVNLIGSIKKVKLLQQGPNSKCWPVKTEDSHSNAIPCWLFPTGKKHELGTVLPGINKDDMVICLIMLPYSDGISIST